MPNFPIGTRDTIAGLVDASCCTAGVKIRAIDVAGNEVFLSLHPFSSQSFNTDLKFKCGRELKI